MLVGSWGVEKGSIEDVVGEDEGDDQHEEELIRVVAGNGHFYHLRSWFVHILVEEGL